MDDIVYKDRYSLLLLGILIVSIIGCCVTLYFLFFTKYQTIQLEIRDYSYNGTHLTVKLGLKTNSTIHPYGLKLINSIHTWTWTKTEITRSDNLTLTVLITITFDGDETKAIRFLLLCDEGNLPFDIVLHYVPKTGYREGLKKTIDWH